LIFCRKDELEIHSRCKQAAESKEAIFSSCD
jgi:hypothetical protein